MAEGNVRRNAGDRDWSEDTNHDTSSITPDDEDGLSGDDTKQTSRKPKKSKELPQRDMYRAFDGSALMALGTVPPFLMSAISINVTYRHANARICCTSSRQNAVR